jgi:hypothetical protein
MHIDIGKLNKMPEKLEAIDESIKDIKKAQEEFKTSFADVDVKMNDLKIENSRLESELNKVEHRCDDLERCCTYLDSEVNKLQNDNTYFERCLKQTNLIFSGVDESKDTGIHGCLGAIFSVLEDNMNIDRHEVSIVKCYRMGAPQVKSGVKSKQGIRPRPIMVVGNTLADRNLIWKNKTKLKDQKIYIGEDYPKATEKRRALLVPIVKTARTIEKYKGKVFLNGDKLTVDKKKFTVETIEHLPEDLNPRKNATKEVDNVTYFFSRWSPLSNHNLEAPFRIGDFVYSCTEQRYFAQKADHLGDELNRDKILKERDPAIILGLGKKLIQYNPKANWEAIEVQRMTEANREKFLQNSKAMAALMATKSTTLAEASPHCRRWGIGYAIHDPARKQRQNWGNNQQGELLMFLRAEFREMNKMEIEQKKA